MALFKDYPIIMRLLYCFALKKEIRSPFFDHLVHFSSLPPLFCAYFPQATVFTPMNRSSFAANNLTLR
jgi:hypothetical protein